MPTPNYVFNLGVYTYTNLEIFGINTYNFNSRFLIWKHIY